MKNQLKITLKDNKNSNIYSYTEGFLTLKKSGSFTIILEEYKNISDNLKKDYHDLRWIYSTINGNMSFTKENYNRSIAVNQPEYEFHFPKVLEGGGLVYIEAYNYNTITELDNSTKVGMLVQAIGEPEIINVQWRMDDGNGNQREILPTETIPLGSTVQLHIFTKGLYGQELEIVLMDKDTFSSDDLLPPIDRTNFRGNRIPDMPTEESKRKFIREVDTYRLEDKITDSSATDGMLITNHNTFVKFIQKCVVDVYIDPFWTAKHFADDTEMKIYPKIKHKKSEDYQVFETNILTTRRDIIKSQLSTIGNKPILVGSIETNFQRYHPCRYNKIEGISQLGGKKLQNVTLFTNEGIIPSDIINYSVIAGCFQEKGKISILTDADTEECSHINNQSLTHKNKVMDISAIAHLIQQKHGTAKGNYRILDSSQYFKHGKIDDTTTNSFSQSIEIKGDVSIKHQESYKILEKRVPFNLNIQDKNLDLEITYDYSFRKKISPLAGLLCCIWPNNRKIAQVIPIQISTCAYQKQVNILVYPDVKWTLQLAFNINEDKFEKVRKKYHKKQTLKIYEADDIIKNLKIRKGLSPYQRRKLKEAYDTKKEAERSLSWTKKGKETIKHYECNVSLLAEYDNGNAQLEISSFFDGIKEFLQKINLIKQKIEDTIDGTDRQSSARSPQKHEKRFERMQELLEKKELKNRFVFTPPSLALSLSWKAEPPTKESLILGTYIAGAIEADPLFEFNYSIDLLTLLGNAHPIARAIVLVVEALDKIAHDKFDIGFEFDIKGKIRIKGEGSFNTASHYNTQENICEIEGNIKFILKLDIRLQGSYNSYIFDDAKAYAKFSGDITSGISISGKAIANKEGLHLVPEIKFLGIVLKAKVELGVTIPKNRYGKNIKPVKNMEDEYGMHYNAEGQLIVMDAYIWKMDGKDGRPNWSIIKS